MDIKREKGVLKHKYLLIISGLIIGSLILFWISSVTSSNALGQLFSAIASALLISGIISIANEYILKSEMINFILSKLDVKKDLETSGLEKVPSDISEIDYKYYINHSKNNIDIFHVYGRTWTSNNMEFLKNRLKNSNCKIRVILLSPTSNFVAPIAELYEKTKEQLEQDMNEVMNYWDDIKKVSQLRKKMKGTNLEVYHFNGMPTHSLYRFDDVVIHVSSKPTKGRSNKLPTFICKDTKKSGDLYDVYLEEIERLIKDSKQVI